MGKILELSWPNGLTIECGAKMALWVVLAFLAFLFSMGVGMFSEAFSVFLIWLSILWGILAFVRLVTLYGDQSE